MAISKIKYPRIDFSGFVNGDSNNQLAVDSNGKLKVGLSAGTGIDLSAAGVISTTLDFTPIAETIDSATHWITIDPYGSRRFEVTQTVSTTISFDFDYTAGLTWQVFLTKNSGDTTAFNSDVIMDKAIDSSWTDCILVFTARNSNDVYGFVVAGS